MWKMPKFDSQSFESFYTCKNKKASKKESNKQIAVNIV